MSREPIRVNNWLSLFLEVYSKVLLRILLKMNDDSAERGRL